MTYTVHIGKKLKFYFFSQQKQADIASAFGFDDEDDD